MASSGSWEGGSERETAERPPRERRDEREIREEKREVDAPRLRKHPPISEKEAA